MRDLIKPYFDEYLSGSITLSDLAFRLSRLDIVIGKVDVNPSFNLCFHLVYVSGIENLDVESLIKQPVNTFVWEIK